MLKYLVVFSLYFMVSNSSPEYGEFDLKITNYETCNAPKRNYCGVVKAYTYDDVWLKYDVLVHKNMTTVRTIFSGKLNKKEVVKIRINNLCEHIFFKPVLKAMYNINTGPCGIYKGHHVFNVDLQAISRTLYGDKYMYGNWTYHSVYYNDNCNLHCEIVQTMVTPRKTFKP